MPLRRGRATTRPMSHLTLLADAKFSGSAKGKPPRKMTGLAYSGGRVPGRNMVIDLASTRAALPAPLLAHHDRTATIGRVTAARIDSSIAVEAELYSDVDETAREIAEKAARGHPWQLSIGLFDFNVEYVDNGKSVVVNGQDIAGPIAVLRDGTVREVSVVALGADPNTTTSFFSAEKEPDAMNIAELTALVATLTAERDAARTATATAEQARDAEKRRADDAATALAAAQATIAAAARERRVAAVTAMFKAAGWVHDEAAAKVYVEMADEAFAAVDAQIRGAARPGALPAHLTQSQTPGDDAAAPAGGVLLAIVKAAHGVK